MRRRTLVGSGLAALMIAAPAAWYYGSPWWTLWRMREAARAGDRAALASYVDFRAIAVQTAADDRAAWAGVLDTVPPDNDARRQLVELAKRRLATRVSEGSLREAALPWLSEIPIPLLGAGGDPDDRIFIVRHRLSHFEVRARRAPLEFGPKLGFRREGLGWKLEEIRWAAIADPRPAGLSPACGWSSSGWRP